MRYFPATTTTLALLLAGPALAQEVDLRGPAFQPGHAIVTTVDSETEAGELKGLMMGNPVEGTIQTTSHQVVLETVLEVEDGEPSKIERRYVEALTVNNMNFNGFDQKQEQKEMEGMVLTLTRDGNDWDVQSEGGNLPDEMAGMLDNVSYTDPRLTYPEGPVAVGAKWKIDGDELAAAMGPSGMPGAEFDGDIKYELVAINQVDGRPVAVLTYEMDVDMIIRMNPQGADGTITITTEGEGLIERDLTTFTDTNVFEGEMQFAMSFSVEGQVMGSMEAEMDMKSTTTQQVKE